MNNTPKIILCLIALLNLIPPLRCEGVDAENAGSTHIAVLSVAPWEKYRDSIQPQFNLTADGALQQVLPNTANYEEKVLNAFAFKLKLGLPNSSSAASTVTQSVSGSDPTVTTDTTQTKTSGTTSNLTFAAAPTTATASGLPGSTLGNTLGFDPMLKYWAASALYQEVQLLNRYVKEAAISEDYAAYIVRLQVSFQPLKRNEPYDVYSTISFFSGDFPPHIAYDKEEKPYNVPSAQSLINCLSAGRKCTCQDKCQCPTPTLPGWTGATSTSHVRILPLLVTDNVETALESHSLERITQLALALQATINGAGAGADIQNVHDKLQSSLSHKFNSQFTVARASENTLRVRFGAAQQGTAKFAAIPQTHNVSLLIMLPKKDGGDDLTLKKRLVHLVSKMSMVNAETGKELYFNEHFLADKAKVALEKMANKKTAFSKEHISLLLRCVYANDYEAFDKIIGTQKTGMGGMHFRDALWTEIASWQGFARYQTAVFEIPGRKTAKINDLLQTPILIDNKSGGITTTIRNGEYLGAGKLSVQLALSLKASQTKNAFKLYLPATAIAPNESGNQMTVTFPSIDGIGQDITEPGLMTVVLENSTYHLNCVFVPRAEPKADFTISTLAKSIVVDKGFGKLALYVDAGKTPNNKITILLKGANVTNATFSTPNVAQNYNKDTAPNKVEVINSGIINFELSNLNPDEKVTISATDAAKLTAPDVTVTPILIPSK